MTAAILDDAGHNPQVEAPRATTALVSEWLHMLGEDATCPTNSDYADAAS